MRNKRRHTRFNLDFMKINGTMKVMEDLPAIHLNANDDPVFQRTRACVPGLISKSLFPVDFRY